jgi:predicted  nucleic acid-binding Zn-ribbon protein
VQDHDAAVDRLRHRRRTLPERSELQALEVQGTDLERTLAGIVEQRDEVARRQRRVEDELAVVEHKLAVEQARLYGGTVSLIRELQAMQAEIDALKRRRSSLEDDVLEAMTEREPLDEEIAGLEAQRAALDERAGALRAAVAEAEAAIDAELEVEVAARGSAVDGIPAPVVSSYERLRTRLDGVGAARLVNGRCDGCHLSLSRTELSVALKEPPDALLHCEQCGRILVR